MVLGSLPQLILMAAIVDTVLFVPVLAILALPSFALFNASLQGFITFGGVLGPVHGLIVWWAVLLVPSLVYAACTMPWHSNLPRR